MVLIRTHGIDIDSWYGYRFMVLTWTHGIESVFQNLTRTIGPSVARMRDLLLKRYLAQQWLGSGHSECVKSVQFSHLNNCCTVRAAKLLT